MIRLIFLFCGILSVIGKQQFSPNFQGRIINGEEGARTQFPWQVGIYISGTESGVWFCGGSIISQEWILTSAHCLVGAVSGLVVSGDINLAGNVTRTKTSIITTHKAYNPENLENDIGLLKLEQRLNFDENTKAVALPDKDFDLDEGDEIVVAGWGLTSDSGKMSESLRFVKLVKISKSDCERSYGTGEIFEGMFCATSTTDSIQTVCSGDSGGPVTTPGQDPLQVGIVSFVGDNGCENNNPSGFTRTGYYRDWIRQNAGV